MVDIDFHNIHIHMSNVIAVLAVCGMMVAGAGASRGAPSPPPPKPPADWHLTHVLHLRPQATG